MFWKRAVPRENRKMFRGGSISGILGQSGKYQRGKVTQYECSLWQLWNCTTSVFECHIRSLHSRRDISHQNKFILHIVWVCMLGSLINIFRWERSPKNVLKVRVPLGQSQSKQTRLESSLKQDTENTTKGDRIAFVYVVYASAVNVK
jgi:hypothetical protein